MPKKSCLKTEHYMKDAHQLSLQFSDKAYCLDYLRQTFQKDQIQLLQLEEILHSIHLCLSTLSCLKSIDNYLENLQNSVIIIDNNKIPVQDTWFSKFLALAPLQFLSEIANCDISTVKALLDKGMQLFCLEKYESKFLLQLIVKLCDCKLDSCMALQLFYFIQIAALTPHGSLKSLLEVIARKVIPAIDKNVEISLDCLPLRGISCTHLSHFANKWTDEEVITRILEMFSNNIHNREAGFLYKLLLNNFEDVRSVWPHFACKLRHIDYEGEFFQSLVKYWIPVSVGKFGSSFYHSALTNNIPDIIKGYILLEIKKQRRYSTLALNDCTKKQDFALLSRLINDEETARLGFQATCWHHLFYKQKVPCKEQLDLVTFYLDRQNSPLGSKDLSLFEELVLQNDINGFLLNWFRYGCGLLKSHRRDLGAQILTALSKYKKSEELIQKFTSESFIKLVEATWTEVQKTHISHPVCDLSVKILRNVANAELLLASADQFSAVLSIKATESISNYTRCTIISTSQEEVSELQLKVFMELTTLAKCTDLKSIFKANLLFEILNQTAVPSVHEEFVRNEYFFAVAALLQQRFYVECDDGDKMVKIVEALYENICQCLLTKSTYNQSKDDCTKIMLKLVEIIENSSMRKPTMLSEVLLKHYAGFYDKMTNKRDKKEAFFNFKMQLLKGVFEKLEGAAGVQSLTIRRNPETRLVVHALCSGEGGDQKTLLDFTLNNLLHLLANPASSNATVASTMHSIEILISDNRLYDLTLSYTPKVISNCVKHFGNRNWTVRNGCIQLLKTLIIRFLGVPIGPNNRPKSIIDLCHIFPEILRDFYASLTAIPLNDSALAVLQFFSESQLKVDTFDTKLKIVIIETFRGLFVKLISEDGFYGLFAAKAYVALCLPQKIPQIIADFVSFVIENYSVIRQRHTVRNFIVLLQELHAKYYNRDKPREINAHLSVLAAFLSKVNSGQFDLLLVKTLSVEQVLQKIQIVDLSCFEQRVWMHNNVPFLVINAPQEELCKILNVILSKKCPEFLQVKVLSILLERIPDLNSKTDLADVLVNKALLDTNSTYLQLCYCKVLSIINHPLSAKNPKLILNLLKKHSNLSMLHISDQDTIESISEMLKYLHQTASCCCQKYKILKLALFILLEHGHWHLLSHLCSCYITTPNAAVQQLISFKFLYSYFQDATEAFRFVKEFYEVKTCEVKEVCKRGYYVEDEEVLVDKVLVRRLVLRFLRDFCLETGREEEFLRVCEQLGNKVF